jgi:hypothetical protein
MRQVESSPIRVDGDAVLISELEVVDRDLAQLLTSAAPDDWGAVISRALSVGARGLLTMGVGLDLAGVDDRLQQTITRLTDEAESRLDEVLRQGHEALSRQLDPEHRSSLIARARDGLAEWSEALIGQIDPDRDSSATTAFLRRLAEAVGPDGDLDRRLAEALDPDADGSAMASLSQAMRSQFAELRDLVVRESGMAAGKEAEAGRGTAQGLDFEGHVDGVLRSWALRVGGCQVEHVGRAPGALGPQVMVGDFVVTLPDGERIAVEVKNQATLGLGGKDGILAELDRTMANREASVAVCISARDAFPAEVGAFGVYGPRVLVVDDGDGVMTSVALQWARARIAADAAGRSSRLDVSAMTERAASIRRLAEHLRTARSSLTEIRKAVEGLHERLGDLRTDILDQVVEMERELDG